MEWSSWNFHLVKQLVTQNVRINFLPSQARNTKFRDYDKSGCPVGWQLCGAPEEWPVNCVPRVHGVLIHCSSDRRQWATPRGELGGSTCEFNKPSMRSTASPGSGACQRSCFPPFRTLVYFSRLESNKMVHKELRQFHVGRLNELLDVWPSY